MPTREHFEASFRGSRACPLAVIALLMCSATEMHAQPPSVMVAQCAAAPPADRDGDGLADGCETALAAAFAPLMAVRSGGCGWDTAQSRPGGGYLHVVEPTDGAVRIAYLPAYFMDCGWEGRKCALPWVNCAPHAGDSEFIVVEAVPGARSEWTVRGVFLSAHCFSGRGNDCRWYRGAALNSFDWHGPAPIVWVSAGRNANYPSWRACDRGHYSIDSCDRNDVWVRFPVAEARNLGSRRAPASPDGCIRGHELSSRLVHAEAVECFWREGADFRGWQDAPQGVTGYARYLREIAEF